MSLRKVPVIALSKSNFIDSGMLTEEMLAYLVEMIEQKDIFLISGNMGSGKTSLLRFLSEYIDKRERLITAEDTQNYISMSAFRLVLQWKLQSVKTAL